MTEGLQALNILQIVTARTNFQDLQFSKTTYF